MIGYKLNVFLVLALIPIVTFIGLLPITLAGIGTRDAAIIYLFSPFVSYTVAFSVGLIFTLIRYIIPSIVGGFFVSHLFSRKRT